MLLAVRVNLDHFVRDLMEGDPFVWTIAVLMVVFTGFGIYQKLRSCSGSSIPESK